MMGQKPETIIEKRVAGYYVLSRMFKRFGQAVTYARRNGYRGVLGSNNEEPWD